MKKSILAFAASIFVLAGASPAQAFNYQEIQCQPGMYSVLYYTDGSQTIVGMEVSYCDSSTNFLGSFGTHSYTQYCGCD